MNTRQLECFIQVADVLNFSVAAKRLFITQPTVTHQIQTLEEEVGVELFKRDKKTVILTAAGSIFYKDAQEILMRENIAKSRVLNTKKNFKEKVALAFDANALENMYLAEIISQYHIAHPEIYLYLQMFDFKIGIQTILDKKMDMLLYTTREAIEHREISYKELYIGKFVALMKTDSELSRGKMINLQNLKDISLIMPEEVVSTVEMKELLSYIRTIIPRIAVHYCDDVGTAHILVKSGLGIALMPDFEVRKEKFLKSVPIELPANISRIPYGLSWHREEKRKEVLNFIDEFINMAKVCLG